MEMKMDFQLSLVGIKKNGKLSYTTVLNNKRNFCFYHPTNLIKAHAHGINQNGIRTKTSLNLGNQAALGSLSFKTES